MSPPIGEHLTIWAMPKENSFWRGGVPLDTSKVGYNFKFKSCDRIINEGKGGWKSKHYGAFCTDFLKAAVIPSIL